MLKKILAILAGIGAAFSAIFYVLFQQKKNENKAINEKFDDMKNNLAALEAAETAEKELKKENEELIEIVNNSNKLDAFNACNQLLQK